MEDIKTDPLRALAPKWCLAGDDKLLAILQNTHQKILSKSQEVNSKVEEMTATLHEASISLQNVNNKFMALSNSQFIESRVYDDDVDITPETKQIKEEPKQASGTDLEKMRNSLSILEGMHEVVTILRDSDTESDSDDDGVARVVLKPKDLYAHRPLPYIIGSQAWRNKWHAGLLVEDSDTDSSTSKPDKESEQYSESEPDVEPEGNIQTDKLHLPDQTISDTSSELVSEETSASVKPSPSDIAAELARRLGGQAKIVERVPEQAPPAANKPVYKPHQPTPGTIFPDEPPPIEQSETSSSEEDGDIFAELHKKQPYNNNKVKSVADDLFGFNSRNDMFNDFNTNKVPVPSVKPKTTLFEDESEPELFAPKPETNVVNNNVQTESDTGAVKKPVGGISLFGTNKGAESIGAAILKRNQRKSSSNDDSDSDEPPKPQIQTKPKPVPPQTINPVKPVINTQKTTPVKKEKDIFDDLFAKSEKSQKIKTLDKDKKVDLFSDNLFDDIDDIFTTNIVKTNNKTEKPIFDVNDDLFADVAVAKTVINNKQKEKKGLFDSDDDLFAENDKVEPKIPVVNQGQETKIVNKDRDEGTSVVDDKKQEIISPIKVLNKESTKIIPEKLNKISKETKVKSIFDDDSSDSDIFSNKKTTEPKSTKQPTRDSLNTGIFNKAKEKIDTNNVGIKETLVKESKSIFDDDDSDGDIFANIKTTPKNKDTNQSTSKSLHETDNTNQSKIGTIDKFSNKTIPFNSPSLFDDDDDEELFTKSKETITTKKEDKDLKVDSEPKDLETSQIVKEVTQDTKQAKTSENIEIILENDDLTPKTTETQITEDIIVEPPPFEEQSNKVSITKEIESKTIESDIFNDDIPAPDPIDIAKDTIIPKEENTVLNKPHIFSDIFTEPPAFEKLKEPKSGQNVNALFGDDSDDEALFFKKDDVISDDKPDLFVPAANADMFGIFVDEPPAIDVDFATKSEQNDKLFESNEIFKSTEITQEVKTPIVTEVNKDINELPKSNVGAREIDKIDGTQAVDNENKKIGKLKTMNFKIDVNALVPGGSPKKKLLEQVDGASVSMSNEELPTNDEKIISKMFKSVSFEGKPDSEVLDNKLSKERAKIQVKRRPSTRRARREAVRKSAIDIDNDSTDNSSSIDDPPKTIPKDNIVEKHVPIEDTIKNNDSIKTEVKSKVVYILNDEDIFDTKPDSVEKDEPIFAKTNTVYSDKTDDFQSKDITDGKSMIDNVNREKTAVKLSDSSNSNVKLSDSSNPNVKLSDSSNSNVKLSDSSNTNVKLSDSSNSNVKLSDSSNSNVKLSDSSNSNVKLSDSSNSNVKLSDSSNTNVKLKEPVKSSLFGELSDDDEALFGKKTTTVKKTNIFESDSDDDLFTGKSKGKSRTATVERKREVIKGSLFGDDDDDDLFGVKTKKISEPKPQSSRPVPREPMKTTETVFVDPLSMLDEDD